MQRYAGEIAQDDDRPSAPMLFDGWGYVPLDTMPAPARPDTPDMFDRGAVEPAEPSAR